MKKIDDELDRMFYGYGIASGSMAGRPWGVEKDDSTNSVLTSKALEDMWAKIKEVNAAPRYPHKDHLQQYYGKFVNTNKPLTNAYNVGFTMTDEMLRDAFKPYANTPSTPKTMTRLTSYNDWTILLEGDKLVAVNSNGHTVRAVGSLLSAGGRAWIYVKGKLWSGELERHETEKEIRDEVQRVAEQKIRAKYNKKLEVLYNKQSELEVARAKEFRSL